MVNPFEKEPSDYQVLLPEELKKRIMCMLETILKKQGSDEFLEVTWYIIHNFDKFHSNDKRLDLQISKMLDVRMEELNKRLSRRREDDKEIKYD